MTLPGVAPIIIKAPIKVVHAGPKFVFKNLKVNLLSLNDGYFKLASAGASGKEPCVPVLVTHEMWI